MNWDKEVYLDESKCVKELNTIIKNAKLKMSVNKFVDVYASNKGITKKASNVLKNIDKYELFKESNFKYLYNILGNPDIIENVGSNFYQMKESTKKWIREYGNQYKKDHYKQLVLKMNIEKDNDIMLYLGSKKDKTNYIKELIRKDMGGK